MKRKVNILNNLYLNRLFILLVGILCMSSLRGQAIDGCIVKGQVIVGPNYGFKSELRISEDDDISAVAKGAFANYTKINSICLKGGVNLDIGENAFAGCTNLGVIKFYSYHEHPAVVRTIKTGAFSGCTGLTSVYIPSIGSIGIRAFSGCTNLTSFRADEMPDIIAEGAFSGCTSLKSITLSNSMKTIEDKVFSGCTGLTSITIPKNVTFIGDRAFEGCTGLTSVTIPERVTSIRGSFRGCTGLTSITIPESVTSINGTFKGCTGLTSIIIPKNVTFIGNGAFEGCTGLTSITIPERVTSIGDGAFSGCTGLTSITIPERVTSIGDGAFSGCTGLTSITIPEGVTSIGDGAFKGCTGLTSITIPESVTSIGKNAFEGCPRLTSITLPKNVTSIGDGTFSGCVALTSVTIPESVSSIGKSAFKGCAALTSITIPESVISIEDSTFEGCSNLTSIYLPNVFTIGKKAFSDCTSLASAIMPQIEYIKRCAFYNCNHLKYVKGGRKICNIEFECFQGCHELTSPCLPLSSYQRNLYNDIIWVNWAYEDPFAGCDNITSLIIDPDSKINFEGFLGNHQSIKDIYLLSSKEEACQFEDDIPKECSIIIPDDSWSYANIMFPKSKERLKKMSDYLLKKCLLLKKGETANVLSSVEDAYLYVSLFAQQTPKCSENGIITIDDKGNVRAENLGSSRINWGDMICDFCVVNDIKAPFEKNLALKIGQRYQYSTEYEGADIGNVAHCESSNKGIVSSTSYEEQIPFIEAIKPGTADVLFELNDSSIILGTYHVKVYDDISFNKQTIILEANKTYKNSLIADGDYSDIAQYVSTDNSVVTVDESGLITAVASGTATIKYVLKDDPSIVLGQYEVKVFANPALDKTSVTLKKGDAEQLRLNASIDLSDDVVYESENTDIASVDAQGVVTGKTPGTTRILCKLKDDLSQVLAQCEVKVYGHVSFDKESVVIEANKTYKNSLTTDGDYSDMAQYISSDNSVVTVDESGLITAVASGTATIKYVLKDDPSIVLGQYEVKVFANPALDKTSVTLKKGDAEQLRLNASIDLSDDVVYESENTDIASVDAQGVVTGKTPGTTRILCKLKDDLSQVLAQCEVKVYGHVSFDKESVVIEANKTYKNSLTTDGDYSDMAQYISSDNSVVTVDESGLITAVASGTATIKYVLKDDPSIVLGQYEVKVFANPALDKTSVTLKKGDAEQLRLNASIDLSDDVVYESENTDIASVDAQGVVTGKTPGTTRILCKLKDDLSQVLAQCEVKVYGHVSFDKESVVIEANKTYNNSLTTDGDYSDIAQYVSSDNSVVTVDGSGLITAVASGTASIKFVLKDDPTIVLDQYDVKVYENLALNKTSMTLKKGNSDRLTLSASIDISEDIIYESENASVASVDAQGLVQGLKLGTTRILCKSKTDASILATCEVMVISENTSIDKVGGIYYEFSDNGEAMVTNAYGGILPAGMTSLPQSYSGSISIPEQVSHNGMNYHVTAIGENAFNGQSALQSVSMPNSVNAIGASAFRDCANLQTIQLSNSLTKILDLTFYGCSSLKNIALPQSIQSIGKSAFRDCQALTSLMFNKELESIGNYAFHNSGLKSIDLSLCSSLTSISPSVFANNKQLTNVVLPANLSSLGYGAFDGDESLSEVTFTTTTDHLTVSNNAFRGCTSLKKVFIADLKSWAQTNFMNPSANPLSMAHHLYLNGNELTKVELPQGTTIINNNAFYGFNSMTSLVIPSSVTQVGDNIFYGCTLLWDVYCKGSVPPVYVGTADASQMNEFFRIATLHIPAGSKKAYTNEEKKFWSRFTHIDEVIVSVTSISFNKSRLTLTAGETFQLVAEILPADASNKNVSWRSNNTNYVKVSAEGLITALLPGSASIYATTEDGGLVAKCFVTVIGNSSAINDVTADEGEEERVVYRLDGTRVHDKHLSPGIYIINGRKVVVKRVK